MLRTIFNHLTLLAFICVSAHVQGQVPEKHIHEREQLWTGYFNQTRFSNRWGIWADVHYRMTDNFARRPFQFLLRPAITYFIKDNLRVHVGYAYAHHFPGKALHTSREEHRTWQQIWWNQKYPGLTTLQWLRLEQRFNEKIIGDVKQEGYNYTFRIRYNFSFFIPLKGKALDAKTPFAAVMNEVFLNFGDNVVYNTFDQNRFFAGFGYQFSSHLNAQLGYMNVYQQEASGNNYFSTHAIRFFVFHSIDLRDKN
ncbi:DUF2490 domain-containing protein [Pseudochryseolinea flava]|uniref:DUF2490 domain-containing protein n=1 Tax=Pseudochryseolinea flava TaxID=2059302 RepID=A0A364Y782_9BACT|nr:DUF2490 domain-containing protein [Pseudochryseolinea flava]RAW02121.1 DUF2490 domain-containing protein [Pseudochryseolinea flava]